MIFYLIASFYKPKQPLEPRIHTPPGHHHGERPPEQGASDNQKKGKPPSFFRDTTATLPQAAPALSQNAHRSTDGGCSTLARPLPALPGQFFPFLLWNTIKNSLGFQVILLLLMISAVVYLNLRDLLEWQTMTESPHATQRGIQSPTHPVASVAIPPAVSHSVTNHGQSDNSRQNIAFFYANNMKNYYCLNYLPSPCDPDQLLRAPIPDSLENIYEGSLYYAQHCTGCHGEGGKGNGPEAMRLKQSIKPLSWVGSDILDRDAYLFWMVARGGSDFGGRMPPFKAILDEKQIWQVVLFLKTVR